MHDPENVSSPPPTAPMPPAAPTAPVEPQISPDALPGWIVEEDDDFIVLNKPAGIVCHPSKDGPWSSIIGAVKAWKQQETLHLVSRLDRETSGILLIAKNRPAARLSQMAMEFRQVSKTYLTLLQGELAAPVLVDEPIARDLASPVAVKRHVARTADAQTAVTFFEPLHSQNGYTLVRVTPHTGRTHQIRVHAQWLGFPVVGDKLYGPDERLYLDFVETGWGVRHTAMLAMSRQALHAARLEFKGEQFQRTFTAPLAEDMQTFCREKLGMGSPTNYTNFTN
ncbi:MAG: RluA family pseudouridine synthase [Puniceicoccales bacterium]|jgi:23S rRNA pseudouridine1911/1915/1917 synthase|nr:RluA family pseudouridine synthase [Puniceicoccales bacterium]